MVVVTVRTNGEDRPERSEGQDTNIRWRGLTYVWNADEFLLQSRYRQSRIGGARDLRRQFHAPVRIRSEVLNRIRKDFIVAHKSAHVVGRVETRNEESDFVHRSRNTTRRNEIANLEGPQNN